jgi:hypothetical protein
MAGVACKQVLTFREVRFSEAQNQMRKWTGVLSVDASRCVAASGAFEIKFVPIKEVGPDLLFSERFKWSPGLTQVSLDFRWTKPSSITGSGKFHRVDALTNVRDSDAPQRCPLQPAPAANQDKALPQS